MNEPKPGTLASSTASLERHDRLPPSNLTESDLRRLVTIFEQTSLANTGRLSFKVSTPWGTYSTDTFDLQTSSYTPIDVTRIEMATEWAEGTARLIIGLEGIPRTSGDFGTDDPSWLAIEGPEHIARPLWHDIMEVFNKRRSWVLSVLSNYPVQVCGLLLTLTGGLGLPRLTLSRAHANAFSLLIVPLLVGLLSALVYANFMMPIFTVRVHVAGWGKISQRQKTLNWWAATIAGNMIAWAIGLLIVWLVP